GRAEGACGALLGRGEAGAGRAVLRALRAVLPGLRGSPLSPALRLLHLLAAGDAPVGVVAEECERAAYGARLAILQGVRGLRALAGEGEVEGGRADGLAPVSEGEPDADVPHAFGKHLRGVHVETVERGEVGRRGGDDPLVDLHVVVEAGHCGSGARRPPARGGGRSGGLSGLAKGGLCGTLALPLPALDAEGFVVAADVPV